MLLGDGDTVSPLKATIIGMGGRVVVVLGIMFVLVKTGHQAWGLTCVWVCIFLDLLFRGVMMEVVFRKGRWKEKRV